MEFVAGNRIELLHCGAEYFPALTAAFEAARESIHLETYIFEGDATGRLIAAALCAAAKRGVLVHVLVDGFGGRTMPVSLCEELRSIDVKLLVYRPKISPLTLRRQRLRRMHRKMVCVDGRVAFVGGINIVDDDDMPGRNNPRHDYAVRVEGPLVAEVQNQMVKLWGIVAWANQRRRWRPAARPPAQKTLTETKPETELKEAPGTHRAALVIRDNFRHRTDIEEAYLTAIKAAREEIIIANAYFLPGRRFRRALRSAAARGVRVHLILQGRAEYLLLHYASRALYGSLLSAGIRIHEYRSGFLHSKVAVCDGHWATVGSSNIDPFSLLLAREANIVIEDREFAGKLVASLNKTMEKDSVAIPRTHWTSLAFWQKLPSWASYSMVRLLMGAFRYGDLN